MSRFRVETTAIRGVYLVDRHSIEDTRGSLTRLFCESDLAEVGWRQPIAQINHTATKLAGTIRGMHFQNAPSSEMKLIMCLRGEIFDVVADLRHGSPTALRYIDASLSAANKKAILIPEGCAHGFQTLTNDVEMLYLHSTPYDAAAEGGVHPEDERLGIQWPLPISAMSDRDRTHPRIGKDFTGVDT